MPKRYSGSQEEQRALSAYVKLSRSAQALEAAAHRHLNAHNLTISQFGVLEALLHLGPLSQRRLAEKILRSSGNLTMVIDNLERDGLVKRERDLNDRRVMLVNLTGSGERLIRDILPGHVRGLTQLFHALSAEEIEELSRLTRKLGLSLK